MTFDERLIVVAIGGNAVYPPAIRGTAEEQLAVMTAACERLARVIGAGRRMVLTHGNGPVVGNILFRMARTSRELAPMPMDVCVAHSQGGMGYMLQQSLANVLARRGMDARVTTVLTEVEVDAADPAFARPTKPVGKFFARDDAARIAAETGWQFVEDAGRGWRRVVPSPVPRRILDTPAIKALLAAGVIPVACGGGGIPVARSANGDYRGVAAVIDKDMTSALLAADLGAGALVMLTAVERVALDFGKPAERWLDRMSAAEARAHLADGQFPPGSMGPKITAALDYLARGGRQALVTSLERLEEALAGTAGTRIVRDAHPGEG
ncbi:MAG: carbamate kinase [Burkholderiales bacterium]|nr:carbamate kinase [Burkholderiales bacterium]